MRLYEEIFKDAEGVTFSRCSVIPRGGGYFEGVKAVEDFSEDCITLCFSQERMRVEGENLSIKKYCDGDLQISGRIFAVYVDNEDSPQGKEGRNPSEKTARTYESARRG